MQEELKFKIVPQYERYYSEDTHYGVYTFTTDDDIPQYSECKIEMVEFDSNNVKQKQSILTGNMQRLYIGSEYEVTAFLDFNKKYNSYQYKSKMITALAPRTTENQAKFLESLLTENQAKNLLNAYPNVVQDVIDGVDNVDVSKIKGIGDKTWSNIKKRILDNYVISDLLLLLQPLGVTFKMINKLLSEESNPSLLKQKLLDNPYVMTKIRGLGFKKVDQLALKLNPDIKLSSKRVYAFIDYYFEQIGSDLGHTWVLMADLKSAINDNIFECMDIFEDVINIEKEHNRLLYFEGSKVGLKRYRNIEERIYQILKNIQSYPTLKVTDEDMGLGIERAEKEQGFEFTSEQKEIIHKSINSNVIVLTGKAGSSKTTTSRGILKVHSKYSIACTALSAKASQRITEATGYQAQTIHRLLKAKGLNDFEYNHDNPLPYDIILVDEASMINCPLFYNLLSAVKEGAKVIIVGDNKQLPPIGYGNIFNDMLQRKNDFCVCELTKVLRQAEQSGILSDANKIRLGEYPINSPELKIVNGQLKDMIYMFRDDRQAIQDLAIKNYLSAVEIDGLDDVTIVVPRKEGCINSTLEMNLRIQDELIPQFSVKEMSIGKKIFRVGAKVIQRVNNYEKNVFNGEVGYITNIWTDMYGNEKQEMFSVTYKMNDSIKNIEYCRNELEQIDLAYALTIHLSQGSGYKSVIVVIDSTHYSLLDTCLLYTAITRAKKRCMLLSEPYAFKKCLSNNKTVVRQTWLKDL